MKDLTGYEKDILKNIEVHGWQYTFVFDPEGNNPNFGYSTGLPSSLGCPEFIVFGLSNELMHDMIWNVYDQIKSGEIISDGKVWDDIIANYQCVTKKVRDLTAFENYARSAKWHWNYTDQKNTLELYQIVWPGTKNRLFPWDKGCALDVIEMQPQLWL